MGTHVLLARPPACGTQGRTWSRASVFPASTGLGCGRPCCGADLGATEAVSEGLCEGTQGVIYCLQTTKKKEVRRAWEARPRAELTSARLMSFFSCLYLA